MTSLFGDSAAILGSPVSGGHDFAYRLEHGQGTDWDDARSVLSEWFSRIPPEASVHIRNGLRNRDDRQFDGALLELYLHETWTRTSSNVVCEPSVANGKRLDFGVSRDGTYLHVEARSVSDPDSRHGAMGLRRTLYHQIQEMEPGEWHLSLFIRAEGPRAPSGKHLREFLGSWLGSLDATVDGSERHLAVSGAPNTLWVSDGWRLQFTAHPGRGPRAGILAGFVAPDHDPLTGSAKFTKALRKKGSKYGRLQEPYLIALGIGPWEPDDCAIADALYGRKGVWSGQDVARSTTYSAVVSVRNLFPIGITECVPTVWGHPAERDVFHWPGLWRRACLRKGEVEFIEPVIGPREFFHGPVPAGSSDGEST